MTEKLNNDPDGATAPSEFKVEGVWLHTQRSQNGIDLTRFVNYVEIFESLYSPFLTLNVNLSDNMSLNNILPLIGEEFIEVSITGPDNKTGLDNQVFYVYKLSDRMQVANKTYVYTLNCISPPAIFDMNMKVSQSFLGQPSELIEKKILPNLGVKKPVYCHPTKNQVSYISNYWTPVQNIKFLCDRSVSLDSGSSSYIFFETIKGFNFVPLDTLVSGEPVSSYFFSDNPHIGGIPEQFIIIHELYVDESFNYINRSMSGAYGNRALIVDHVRKQYRYSYYDFLDAYEKFNRLNDSPLASNDVFRRINSVFRVRSAPSLAISKMPSESNEEWFQQRLTELATIDGQKLNIDVIGNFGVTVGNVIQVVIPQSNITSEVTNFTDDIVDKTLSGRYLITGLKHMLTRERHTMHLEISRDSNINTNVTTG